MVRIRRFGVARTATVFALWTLAIGLLILIPFAIVILAAGDLTTTDGFGNEVSFSGGAAIIIFLVALAIYAGLGWIFTAISLLVYNLVAGWVGGVEMELVNVVPQYAPYPPAAAAPPQSPAEYPPPQYPPPQPPQYPPPQEPPAG